METIENKIVVETVEKIKEQVQKVIVEQEDTIDYVLTALLSGGHVLLEGVPGLAKTLMVRVLAKTMDMDFNRIQFTPDLMPSDITGTKIYNMNKNEFELKKGPIFSNFVLGDEINRTPPKTQAGLLETMEEQSVTIDGEMLKLSQPYMVFATQNPIEYEGTYPLPEALLDRFIMKLKVDYPSLEAETQILLKHHRGFSNMDIESAGIEVVCTKETILQCIEAVKAVKVDEAIIKYMVNIIASTRNQPYIEIGCSPRGSIALLNTSKAYAALSGRNFVIPEDVKKVAFPALRHRITVKPEVEIEGTTADDIINTILSQVKVPR